MKSQNGMKNFISEAQIYKTDQSNIKNKSGLKIMVKNTNDALQFLLDTFHKEKVNYCHWKSNQHLDDSYAGLTDLDILVEISQENLSKDILKKCGFKFFKSQKWKSYPNIEDWLGYDYKKGCLIHIHLHYKLVTGKKGVKEYYLPWENYILNKAVKHNEYNINVIDPNIEIILLYLRIAIKTKKADLILKKKNPISENILEEINYLKSKVSEREVRKNTENIFGNSCDDLLNIISSEYIQDTQKLLKLKRYVQKIMAPNKRVNVIQTKYLQINNFVNKLFSKIFRKSGYIVQAGKRPLDKGKFITIIGVDGAGKSTISTEIFKWLKWKVDIHKLYLGSGDGSVGVLTKFKQATQRSINSSKGYEYNKNKKTSLLKDLIGPFLRVTLAKERLRKIKRAVGGRNRGSIIIADRFPQNQFYGIYDGPSILRDKGNSKVRKLYSVIENRLYRKITEYHPDIVFKLVIPAQVAHERKPDHNLQIMEYKTKVTNNLTFKNSKVIEIDATAPLEDVKLKIKDFIWESI